MKINLSEVKKLQKRAGLITEDFSFSENTQDEMYEDIIQDIVGRANGSKTQEYDFTFDVIKERGIEDIGTVTELYRYARGANYHSIADACKEIIKNMRTNKDY